MAMRVRGADRLDHWISQWAFRRAALRMHLSTGVFVHCTHSIEWRIYTDIFADGDYDLPLLRLLEHSAERPLIVADLGSNVGFFALRLAHLAAVHSVPRRIDVEGFEASAALCAQARQRWAACKLDRCDVRYRVTRGLVGRKAGWAEIFHRWDHGNNSLFRRSRRGEAVPYLDLTAHFANVDRIDLIKCDVEGAEQMFFETYPDLLRKTRAVVVEFHANFCDPAECRRLLERAGLARHRVLEEDPEFSLEYFESDRDP